MHNSISTSQGFKIEIEPYFERCKSTIRPRFNTAINAGEDYRNGKQVLGQQLSGICQYSSACKVFFFRS